MLSEAQLAAVRPGACRSPVGQQAFASDPWQFVPAAWSKLRDPNLPESARNELRFAVALSLARLGLRTVAREALVDCLHPAKTALSEAIEEFPDDGVPHTILNEVLESNLRVLREPVRQHLARHLPEWLSQTSHVRAFRTTSGSTVLLHRDGSWLLFVDSPGMAHAFRRGPVQDGPFYVDGFHAPHAIEALWLATQKPAGEVQPRLVLMSATASEALTCLSLKPMPELLASPRIEVWCDPHCPQRLTEETRSRFASVLGWAVTIPGPPVLRDQPHRWARGGVAKVLADAGDRQIAEVLRLRQRLDRWESEIDPGVHRERLLGVLPDRPRIVVFTTRFSTYIRHAAEDVAEVLRRLGCDVLVSMEPDDHSTPSAAGILGVVERQHPDLILLINMLRSQMPDCLPKHVPVLTWIQDAMPHLFDGKSGRAFGEYDFVMGHLHPEMFSDFGFPRERSLASFVLASDVTFHDAPADEHARARFSCEVAYVSNQSETAEQFRDRVLAREDSQLPAPRVLGRLYPLVVDAAAGAGVVGPGLIDQLRDVTLEAFHAAGFAAPSPQVFAWTLHSIVHPLAERVLRQQMVHWAAELCDRKGWRLHLYGKGWDAHARFGRFAQGILAHGDDLRLAYQCARVQLHAGLGGVNHQRVLECALSGGCTLIRIKAEDARLLEWWAQNEVARTVARETLEPAFTDRSDYLLCPLADHWEAMMAQMQCDRLGMPPQHNRAGKLALHIDQLRSPWRERNGESVPFEAAWLAGDLAESGFWDRVSFERAVSRVVESPIRRGSLASWQQNAARDHFSLSKMMQRAMHLVGCAMPKSYPAPAMSK